MKTILTLFLLFSCALPAMADDLQYVLSQRVNWPSNIKMAADFDAPLYTSKGKKVGSQPLSTGRSYKLHGVYKQGVAIKMGSMVAFVPHTKTDIVDSIKGTIARREQYTAKALAATQAQVVAETKTQKVQPKVAELIDDNLIDANGDKRSRDELGGKYVGLYFSAHWCPPCRAFTPKLVEFRDNHAKEFEVVFVSSDRSAKDQKDYMQGAKMKWLSTPNGSESGSKLSRHFSVRGIPKLVILDPSGNVVSENGRGDISSKGARALDDWKSKSN